MLPVMLMEESLCGKSGPLTQPPRLLTRGTPSRAGELLAHAHGHLPPGPLEGPSPVMVHGLLPRKGFPWAALLRAPQT